ncbi:hypothetical protein TNCV_4445111 [Trichonephila clavipes]|nr:hypothetical protein TNCV_4445111 [Trichonephila clavipes]
MEGLSIKKTKKGKSVRELRETPPEPKLASDGRSPVPKVTIAVFTFALFTGNGILWKGNVLSCPTSVNELLGVHSSHARKVQ